MKSEYIIYALIVGAFLALGWACTGWTTVDDGSRRRQNWQRLPWILRASWGISSLFTDTLGATCVAWMPQRAKRYSERAVIAALPLTDTRVFAAKVALALIGLLLGAGLGWMLLKLYPQMWITVAAAIALFLGMIGWLWPSWNLAAAAQKRQADLVRELPFAIDLIAAGLRAGLDFKAALRYYVDLESGSALEEEFSRVLRDITLNRPLAVALSDMAARVQLEAFSSFAGVVAYGADVGAPIATTIERNGEDLRRARFHLAERKAARAPAVMIIPLVLFLMPAVFIVLLTPMFMRMSGVFHH